MKQRKLSRVLGFMLSLVLGVSLAPAAAVSAETVESGGIVLSKTAALEVDGSYTIDLEAYVKGEVETTAAPTDIVMVLDTSKSMEESIESLTKPTYTRVSSKQTAQTYYNNSRNGKAYYYYDQGVYRYVKFTKSNNSYTASYRNASGTLTEIQSGVSYDRSFSSRFYTITASDQLHLVTDTAAAVYQNQETGTQYYCYVHGTISKVYCYQAKSNSNSYWLNYYHYNSDTKKYDSTDKTLTDYYSGTERFPSLFTIDDSKLNALKSAATQFVDIVANQKNASDRMAVVHFGDKAELLTDFTSVNAANSSSLKKKINDLTTRGATRTDFAFAEAAEELANSNAGSNKVLVFFTDGAPGYGEFEPEVANATVTTAKTLKSEGVSIYSIAVFDGANVDTTTDSFNAFMNAVSSNFPAAESYNSLGAGSTSNGFYKVATSTSELSEIFKQISSAVTSTELTAESIVRDTMGSSFRVSDSTAVTMKTADYLGDGMWAEPAAATGVTESRSGKSIDVTGFDFKANNVHERGFNLEAGGKKLLIQVTGILPDEENFVSGTVPTNTEAASGVLVNSSKQAPIATFPVPQTSLAENSYVLDYAKTAGLSDTAASTIMNNIAAGSTSVSAQGKYGLASLADGQISYTPNTTNWNSFDTFYAFNNVNVEEHASAAKWSKVNVIPASSVYYEDDFTTVASEGSDARIGIEYSGSWETAGESQNNTETANGDVQGWETSLADDAGYTDGSAHASGVRGATATFTFTGKGLDIYSRTNLTTGKISVSLTGTVDGTKVSKKLLVDTAAVSNGETGYYQIPTASFMDLAYGTYTVTIRVSANSDTASGAYTYYLDGIRVYNPIDDTAADTAEEVTAAYGDQALSNFTELRQYLIDSANKDQADLITAVAFIDGTSESTSDLGTFEELGPKNEIYLSSGNAVVFRVNPGCRYYVGLKSLTGATASAKYTNGDSTATVQSISHTSDLYYAVTPDSNGYVSIQNTGSELLSVTKLCTAGTGASGLIQASAADLVQYYTGNFTALAAVAAEEAAEVSEGEASVSDVVIEETDDSSDSSDAADTADTADSSETTETAPQKTENSRTNIWSNFLRSFVNWMFGRR